MKKVLIISSALVAVLIVSYVGFWFFKAQQFKKVVNAKVIENSSNNSVGEIQVSGFPLTQKMTIKDLKYFDSEGSITFKNVEVEGGILASEYSIKITEPIILENKAKKIDMSIEFNADTKISYKIDEQKMMKILYSGSGYKIFDRTKNTLVATVEFQNSESEVTIDETGNFLTYKHKDSGSKLLDEKNNLIFISASSFFDIAINNDETNKKATLKITANIKDMESSDVASVYGKIATKDMPPQANIPAPEIKPVVPGANKSSFEISSDIVFTENPDKKIIDKLPPEQMAKIPEESKAVFQEKPTPYFVALDLKKLEFTNAICKVFVSGSVNTFAEDTLPSGSLSLKIENFDNLIKNLLEKAQSFMDGVQSRKSLQEVQIEDGQPTKAEKTAAILDNTVKVIKEIASRNSQSKEGAPVFDIKREKSSGTNFTVNNLTFLEIMMMFSPPESQVPGITDDQNQGLVQPKMNQKPESFTY